MIIETLLLMLYIDKCKGQCTATRTLDFDQPYGFEAQNKDKMRHSTMYFVCNLLCIDLKCRTRARWQLFLTQIWDCKMKSLTCFFIVAQFYVLLRVFQVNVIAPSHKATQNREVTAPREKEAAGSDEGGRNGRWRSAKKQGWATVGCRDGMSGFQRISTFTAAASLVTDCPCANEGQMSAMPRWGGRGLGVRRAKHMRSKDTHHVEVQRLLYPSEG